MSEKEGVRIRAGIARFDRRGLVAADFEEGGTQAASGAGKGRERVPPRVSGKECSLNNTLGLAQAYQTCGPQAHNQYFGGPSNTAVCKKCFNKDFVT